MPGSGSTSWTVEMKNLRFGNDEFAIVVEDFDPVTPFGYSQLLLRLEGPGWRIGGDAYETVGVIVPKLVEFGRTGAIRHWGSFAGALSAEGVMERVESFVFAESDSPSAWEWEASSALHRYVLSSLFDTNLGTARAVAVRSGKHETIVVKSNDGTIEAHGVPASTFDAAIAALSDWTAEAESRMGAVSAGDDASDG